MSSTRRINIALTPAQRHANVRRPMSRYLRCCKTHKVCKTYNSLYRQINHIKTPRLSSPKFYLSIYFLVCFNHFTSLICWILFIYLFIFNLFIYLFFFFFFFFCRWNHEVISQTIHVAIVRCPSVHSKKLFKLLIAVVFILPA